MNQEESLRLMAGAVVLAGVAGVYFISAWFLLFLVFVGLNLIQSAFTKWCPAMWLLDKCGVKGGCCSR
ncbi:MAG: DUF2892 domain-containing protein [Elusimicrobia bacterium]|nr:DUF2892 domain-containing protein [Elusimicrobiota bacterium]